MKPGFLILCASIFLVCLMPSSESLWIDEGVDAVYAAQESFGDWLFHLRSETKSQAQMPLPMFTLWAWAQLAGTSEYALRSANILWGILTVFLFYLIGRKASMKWLPLVTAVHPFLWFYSNEARPYAMQITAATLLLWAFLSFVEKPTPRILFTFILATWLLSATSIINYVLAGILSLTLLFWPGCRRIIFSKDAIPAIAIGLVLHLPLIAYYLSTLLAGTGGVKNLIVKTGFVSVAFAFYELSGFFGLGPGRDAIRETVTEGGVGALAKLFANRIWLLLATFLCLFASLIPLLLHPRKFTLSPAVIAIASCVVAFVSIILVAAIAKHTALWGRHLAAVFPFMVFILWKVISLAEHEARSKNMKFATGVSAGMFLSLLLIGSLLVRYGNDFRKDDYRSATASAISAAEEGKVVWWAGALEAAQYYAGMDYPLHERLIMMEDYRGKKFDLAPEPDMIVLGRGSIYDTKGNITEKATMKFGKPDTSARNFRIWKR
jgi:hypothetical protein